MISREELRIYLIEGATVLSRDREKVGTIISTGEDHFVVEKGIFFPKDYLVRFDEVAVANADEIVLVRTRDELRELSEEELERATKVAAANPTSGIAGTNAAVGEPGARISGHTSDVERGENQGAAMSDIQPGDLGLEPIDRVVPAHDVAERATVPPANRRGAAELPPELAPSKPTKPRPRI